MDEPVWRDWELRFSRHVRHRMSVRVFSETDLRVMLETIRDWRPSVTYGRFVLDVTRDEQPWEIVVEPDELAGVLVAVTAYPVS